MQQPAPSIPIPYSSSSPSRTDQSDQRP
jgi:hypothetical protein